MSSGFIQQKATGKINKTVMKNYTYNFHPTHHREQNPNYLLAILFSSFVL